MSATETVDTKPKRKQANQFRLNVKSEDARLRLARWADQIRGQRNGARVKYSDIVEYILLSHGDELSNSEIKAFQDTYFSELDIAKWAVRELMAAEARGEKLSLIDILNSSKPKHALTERKVARRHKIENSIEIATPSSSANQSGKGFPAVEVDRQFAI